MDEKTAKIPSLKEFKETRKERDAHSQRSSSMQTKRQLEKSLRRDNSPRKNDEGKSASRQKTNKNDIAQRRRRQTSSDTQRVTEYPSPQRGRQSAPSPKPRTYVRDTLAQNSQPQKRDSYRDEPLRQYRSQDVRRERPAYSEGQVRRRTTAQQSDRRQSAQNTRRRPQNPPAKRTSQVSKPRKPISPGMRKIRNVIVYISLILAVLVVGLVLSLTVLFKTEEIIVTGNGKYSAQEIIEASGLVYGENIFTASKSRASGRIEKAYPMIEDAHVYFSIPNAIKIDLTMAKPAYMVESVGGYYTVSDKGKVLEVSTTDDEAKVPIIEGVEFKAKSPGEYLEYESDIVTNALEEIFVSFRELGCKNITAVNVETSEGGTVKFRYVYDNRIVVYLGVPDHLSYKIHTADTILREKIDTENSTVAGELDVSKSYDTKKSYFNEYTILAGNVPPATAPGGSEPTTASQETTSAYDDNYDSNGDTDYYGDYGDSNYSDDGE